MELGVTGVTLVIFVSYPQEIEMSKAIAIQTLSAEMWRGGKYWDGLLQIPVRVEIERAGACDHSSLGLKACSWWSEKDSGRCEHNKGEFDDMVLCTCPEVLSKASKKRKLRHG